MLFTLLALFLLLAIGPLARAIQPAWNQSAHVQAQTAQTARTATGTIAYIRGDTRDDIRLIEPDGSDDRLLWSHGVDDPQAVYDIWSLAWRPDASELAFASTHEAWCSVHGSDIFALGSDASGYRRLTQAPACDELATYPQGRVTVPVQNNSGDSFVGFLYIQGASSAQQVSLAPGGSTEVVFAEVADLGPEQFQYAVMAVGSEREVFPAVAANVVAEESVQTPTLSISGAPIFWGAHQPTWRQDGTQVGYVFGFNGLEQIAPRPAPLEPGEPILATQWSQMPDFVNLPTWSPAATQANQLLYAGYEAFTSTDIYRVAAGSTSAGDRLVTYDTAFAAFIVGLAWLPDGSGFVYSVLEDEFFTPVRANIYAYNFSTGNTTSITVFSDVFAAQLSVSPDGEQIVFERGSEWAETQLEIVDPDLWIINRDGSGLRLLVENGRAPAWSQQQLTAPQTPAGKTYLPFLQTLQSAWERLLRRYTVWEGGLKS